jgi:hypothetical protein
LKKIRIEVHHKPDIDVDIVKVVDAKGNDFEVVDHLGIEKLEVLETDEKIITKHKK